MPTIITDSFKSGASISMDMDSDSNEVYVFVFPSGGGCEPVRKWPLDSYHLPIAMAFYTTKCEEMMQ